MVSHSCTTAVRSPARRGSAGAGGVVSRSLIDLHFHALPHIDDGPRTLERALELCAAAAADGTSVVVATPHINFEYPGVDADTVHAGFKELRVALDRAEIPLEVRAGGEVALARVGELSDAELRRLTLDGGPTLLLELPWRGSATGMVTAVGRVAARGFHVLLAHPERTPLLREDPGVVAEMVQAGAWCCLNAASLTERAGRETRSAARRLLAGGPDPRCRLRCPRHGGPRARAGQTAARRRARAGRDRMVLLHRPSRSARGPRARRPAAAQRPLWSRLLRRPRR